MLFTGYPRNNYCCTAKIYSCQVYNGDVLVRDFRPCLNPQTLKPAMYDMMSGKYYYNQGTGEDFKYEYTFTTLDYIESEEMGDTYIKTDIVPTLNTVIKGKFNLVNSEGLRFIFGTSSSLSQVGLAISQATNPKIGRPYFGITDSSVTPVLSIYTNTDYSFRASKNEFRLNNDTYSITSPDTLSTSQSNKLHIFTRVSSVLTGNVPDMKLYEFQVEESNIKILDLIPVRKLDGTIGMYDFISGEYKLNSSTGEFKAGYKEKSQLVNLTNK